METYIYKMVALSAIFILLYYVFLEKEKNHHFKRFYLLISIVFSLLIPFISITYGVEIIKDDAKVLNHEIYSLQKFTRKETSFFTIENILFVVYISGFLTLIIKFSFGIYKLFKEISTTSTKIKKNNFYIILKENKITPHSFWNYVFLYKKDFLENKIDAKILLHEEAHIKQKHSLDVLFIEFLLCVFWFNPAFYFYKKAIITNHEFLADETVLQQNQDVENYQELILNELISEKILFTHPFNLTNTKKRMIMMTTKLTKIAKLKSYLTIPISAILFFLFVEKVPAKIVIDKTEKALKSTDKISEIKKSAIITESFPKFDDRNLPKDTIKQKIQKTENVIKGKTKKVAPISKSNENLIPPPPPIEKIESQTPAEFPGGMIALRQKFINNFDARKLEDSKGYIKGVIKMLVSEDGKNYNAEYEFENEEFKIAAKEALEKTLNGVEWKPGTLNGKPVASALKMPMTMNFE